MAIALSGSSCLPRGGSALDDLAKVLGKSVDETEQIIGSPANTAQTAEQWLKRIDETLQNDAIRGTCSLVATLAGVPDPIPRSRSDAEALYQFLISGPETVESLNLKDEVANYLTGISLITPAAVEAYRLRYC